MSSAQANTTTLSPSTTSTASPTSANLGADLKPASAAAASVKPCCVCKDEKSARDECMLFSNADDPGKDCEGMVERYRGCMRGFGFDVR